MKTSPFAHVQAFRPRRLAPKPLGCGTACLLMLLGPLAIFLGFGVAWIIVELTN